MKQVDFNEEVDFNKEVELNKEVAFQNLVITVVGLGLIGGSMAMALKKLGPRKIWGVDIDREVLRKAEKTKVIDGGFTEGASVLPTSDLVIICLYPSEIGGFIRKNMPFFKPNAVLTDIGGLKQSIISEIRHCLRPDLDFVGGHPLAGREGSGFAQATAEIWQGANYILTPAGARKESVLLLEKMIKGLGCHAVIYMDPEEHDRIIALTSHLPHVVAAALMTSNYLANPEKFIGGSFRDATRVAVMNVNLWSELLLENKDNVLRQIDIFLHKISKIKQALQKQDATALKHILEKANASRRLL